MQSSMWLILTATVGLAALLDRHQSLTSSELLGVAVDCGGIQIRLPARWPIEEPGPGMLTATEADVFPPVRQIQVTVAPPAEPSLVDHILKKEYPSGTQQTISFGTTGQAVGQLYISQKVQDDDGSVQPYGRVVASAVVPNGPQVTIRIEHIDRNQKTLDLREDIALIRRIAATVEISESND